ncbi:MAG: PHB depolymerase family esterase [Paracoccaceae bacterium]
MRWFALILCLIAPLSAGGQTIERCIDQTPCALGARAYHVSEPGGWDGRTALPVLLHFHGWGRQGTLIVQHPRIAGATTRRNVLLVAPNGLGRSWDFWRAGSDDVAFARAVLDDVQDRYPIDLNKIFVSGYSWGSNMAWRFVCDDGSDIAALLAISGTLDQDEICATGPADVRQVYGLKDNVLDFPFGPNGERDNPVKLWRMMFECGEAQNTGPWQQVPFLTLDRLEWTNCAQGRVSLDIHPGGHFIPHGWIARQLDELLGLPNSYP